MKRIFVGTLAALVLTTTTVQAQTDWGQLFGRVVGGAAGFLLGKEACGVLFDGARPENRGFAQGICAVGGAVAGAVILGELTKSGNQEDINDYMDTHRQAYSGPIGEPVELRAGGYRGRFTPMNEYRHRSSGRVCRVIRYEAIDSNRRPVYRSQVRDRNNRVRNVSYVEKFECHMGQNQWAERRFEPNRYDRFDQNDQFQNYPSQGQYPPQGQNQPRYPGVR